MSKAIQGAAMLAGAVAMGAAAFVDPALVASPFYDKLMASLFLGGISMEAGAIAQALTQNRGTGITIRQPAAYRQIVYGVRRVGGVLVYTSTTGSHHDQYNAVIVLAGHEVDAIENMYIDGRQVYWQGSGPGWSVRNGTGFGGIADSANHVGPGGQTYNFGGTGHSGIYVEARYGNQLDGDVISGLTANDPNWAADGHGNSPWLGGCCYVYVKLEYNESLFPGGPAQAELKFTVRGKNNLYDPRTGTYGYSSNWALIINDLLTDSTFGLGDLGSVNQSQLIAAANVCDESVPLANGNSELRYAAHWAYDTSSSPGDALANLMAAAGGRLSRVGGEWYIWPAYWTGPSFAFDKSVLSGDLDWNPYRSLRELCNRVNGTYIAPNVPYNDAGNLYDSNGWYNGTILNNWPFGFQPTNYPQYAQDTLHGYASDALLAADSRVQGAWASGTTYAKDDVITYSGVIYRSLINSNVGNQPDTHSYPGGSAAVWASGTTYAAGAAAVYSSQLYVSLVNSNTNHQPNTSPTYWAAVAWVAWSNQLPMELDFNCVLSVSQAQRLAKIALLRNRQQGKGTFPLRLTAWQMMPLDVFTIDFDEMAWSAKQLEVASTRFFIEDQNGAQAVCFEAVAQETDQTVYEWSTSEELSVYAVPANPSVGRPSSSLESLYTISPQFALTQPTSTSIAVAAFSANFGTTTVNYAARTLTISAPGSPTWYYVTVADPGQQGESGSPTLTATASTSNSLVGVLGNTFVGAILVTPSGSGAVNLAGGWPAPQTFVNLG